MSVLCPIDHKDDAIQRIPAIVAGGTASGSFSGSSGGYVNVDGKSGYVHGSTTVYGTLTSDLAVALARPAPPKEISCLSMYGWSWLFYLSICIIVGPFLVWPAFKRSIVRDPITQKQVFTPGLSFGSILLLLVGWTPYFCWFFISLKKTLKQRLNYPRRYQQWNEAVAIWERLYYCHRCGMVFDPVTNDSFSPNQLRNYLRVYEYEL